MTDVSAAAVKQRAEQQLSAATTDMVTQGNIEAHPFLPLPPATLRASPAEQSLRPALLGRAKQ